MLLPSPSLEGSHHLLHGAQPLSFVPFFCGFVYFTVFVRHFLRLVIVTAVFSQSDVTDEFAGQCVLSPRLPVQGSAMAVSSHVLTEHA